MTKKHEILRKIETIEEAFDTIKPFLAQRIAEEWDVFSNRYIEPIQILAEQLDSESFEKIMKKMDGSEIFKFLPEIENVKAGLYIVGEGSAPIFSTENELKNIYYAYIFASNQPNISPNLRVKYSKTAESIASQLYDLGIHFF